MIDQYRQEYASFNSDLTLEFYLYHSGRKDEFSLRPIYERYIHLFDSDSIDRLTRELKETSPHFESSRTALNHLLCFAINGRLEGAAKEITEAISLHESSAKMGFRETNLTFQDSAVAVGTEGDPSRRREVYDWRASVITSSNSLRIERLRRMHEAARKVEVINLNGEVGFARESGVSGSNGQATARAKSQYSSYLSLYQDLYNVDYSALAENAKSLLIETDAVFDTRLRDALRRDLGIEIENASRSDAIYFSHLSKYDDVFPASRLMSVYRTTMEGLGICPEMQSNIEIDAEDRPKKSARAFCAPVRIPQEIHLVYRPYGGQSDYNALLHEAGHAQHYAWTSPSLQPEFKYTGDPALTETYAFLFNHLSADEIWLADVLGFDQNREFLISTLLTRLLTVRRYAGKLLYEVNLHSGGELSNASHLYSEIQTRATKFQTGEEEFLFDVDDSFYSAAYLRAWAFEAILREHLKRKFGRKWWAERRAGSLLKEIWETGERYSCDQVADQLGIGPVSFDLLINEFQSALK